MKVAGIDFGRKRVGIAVADEGWVVPVDVLEGLSEAALLDRLGKRLAELAVEHVVVGWPLNMDGSAGFQAHAAERFAEKLRLNTGLTVELHDERLTSFEARLRRPSRTRRGKRPKLDAIAACVMLEGWLQTQTK